MSSVVDVPRAWTACVAEEAAAPGGGNLKPGRYSITYALEITANPNEGTAGIGVLAFAEDGKTLEYCRTRSTWAGVSEFPSITDPWTTSEPVVDDACDGEYVLCYPVLEVAPEPSSGHPFTWLDFGHVNATDVARVSVQYGGPQQDAVIVNGHWFASGTLTQPQSKAPRVRAFDAGGKQVYDSAQDPHYDQASH